MQFCCDRDIDSVLGVNFVRDFNLEIRFAEPLSDAQRKALDAGLVNSVAALKRPAATDPCSRAFAARRSVRWAGSSKSTSSSR